MIRSKRKDRGEKSGQSGRTSLTGIYECIYLKLGVRFMAFAKAQLVKWGNSQAVRIPKTILEQCNLPRRVKSSKFGWKMDTFGSSH